VGGPRRQKKKAISSPTEEVRFASEFWKDGLGEEVATGKKVGGGGGETKAAWGGVTRKAHKSKQSEDHENIHSSVLLRSFERHLEFMKRKAVEGHRDLSWVSEAARHPTE